MAPSLPPAPISAKKMNAITRKIRIIITSTPIRVVTFSAEFETKPLEINLQVAINPEIFSNETSAANIRYS
jgi:hypothetical protein